MKRSIWIGFDPREADAFRVAIKSTNVHLSQRIRINSIALPHLEARGLYQRRHERRDGVLYDVISDAPMSTEFAIARFLTPVIAETGWALFCDGDILARADLVALFAMADPRYAVMCVKHENGGAAAGTVKMDGQPQTSYPRKNWSSVMLFNCDHPKNEPGRMVAKVRAWPGRRLHRFDWLDDDEIGDLPPRWNHLVGVDRHDPDAAIAHFTLGLPDMPGYESSPFAHEWRSWL